MDAILSYCHNIAESSIAEPSRHLERTKPTPPSPAGLQAPERFSQRKSPHTPNTLDGNIRKSKQHEVWRVKRSFRTSENIVIIRLERSPHKRDEEAMKHNEQRYGARLKKLDAPRIEFMPYASPSHRRLRTTSIAAPCSTQLNPVSDAR